MTPFDSPLLGVRHFWRVAGIAVATAICAGALALEPDLPKRDPGELMDLEPKLIPKSPAPDAEPMRANGADLVVRLEVDLERAKRGDAAGERQVRAGIIAKVEAENRALKVVRLTSELEAARLALLQGEVDLQRAELAEKKGSRETLNAAEEKLAERLAAATAARLAWERAELKAAELNLSRRRQLLAAGIGRKSDVQRAEEQLAALKEKGATPR